MKLPVLLIPILKKMSGPKGNELAFWQVLEGMDLTEKFFELSSQIMINAININQLPEGYRLVTLIYYWETNCQFSGWYSLENLSSDIDEITRCFDDVGLSDEAKGIRKAAEIWSGETQNYDEVSGAYNSIKKTHNDENSRWVYLNQYFKNNETSLFYN